MDGGNIKRDIVQLLTFVKWMLDGDIGFMTKTVGGRYTVNHVWRKVGIKCLDQIEWWYQEG